MEQVAQMLGVELDEEFNVDGFGDFFKITKDGLWCKYNKEWNMTILSTEDILCGRIKIIKKPILDEVEKEYLSNVIKPFRDRIEYIIKNSAYSPIEWITIKYKDGGATNLPLFEKGTMYQGMEVNKKYSLEDLGL